MKLICLIISILFFSSCNKLDLALDLAPRLIANSLDDSFDFTSERYDVIKDTIEKDLKQNKKIAVEEILKSVEQILLIAEKKQVTKADFENNIADLKNLQKKAVNIFQPTIKEVVDSLSKKEFEHMKGVIKERFEKADERLLDLNKFKRHSLAGFEKTWIYFLTALPMSKKIFMKNLLNRIMSFIKCKLISEKIL